MCNPINNNGLITISWSQIITHFSPPHSCYTTTYAHCALQITYLIREKVRHHPAKKRAFFAVQWRILHRQQIEKKQWNRINQFTLCLSNDSVSPHYIERKSSKCISSSAYKTSRLVGAKRWKTMSLIILQLNHTYICDSCNLVWKNTVIILKDYHHTAQAEKATEDVPKLIGINLWVHSTIWIKRGLHLITWRQQVDQLSKTRSWASKNSRNTQSDTLCTSVV